LCILVFAILDDSELNFVGGGHGNHGHHGGSHGKPPTKGMLRQQLEQLLRTAQQLSENDNGDEFFWTIIITTLRYFIDHHEGH
jgi:hypothetical protein